MVFDRKAMAAGQRSEDQVEPLESYRPGGYHPVYLGDRVGNHFEVVHKLGFGPSSTVWLCWHKDERKWVALKIFTAKASWQDRPELELLNELKRSACGDRNEHFDRNEWERNGIYLPWEYFWIEGPNGRHLCEVLPVLGVSLKDEWSWGMESSQMPLLKELLFQTVSAVDFIHSKGICHGALEPSNIVMEIEDITFMEKDELMELLGNPRIKPVVDASQIGYLVLPARRDCLKLKKERRIAIINFDLSFRPSRPPSYRGISCRYSAPEMVYLMQPSFPSDIWTLICTLFEIRMYRGLFDAAEDNDELMLISVLEDSIGPLPEPYRAIYINKFLELKEVRGPGFWRDIPPENPQEGIVSFRRSPEKWRRRQLERQKKTGCTDPFEVNLAETADEHWDIAFPKPECEPRHQEIKMFGDLLRKTFKWDPEERIDIAELLQHEWFHDRESLIGCAQTPKPTAEPVEDEAMPENQEDSSGDLKTNQVVSKWPAWLPRIQRTTMIRTVQSWMAQVSREFLMDFGFGFLIFSLPAILLIFLLFLRNFGGGSTIYEHSILIIISTIKTSTSTYSQGLLGREFKIISPGNNGTGCHCN
ncbi:kinase-like protein [Xylariaceae sp. FL0255]|nr:kinase-like protein [Xylariaceae sp. FL0255]